MTSLCIFGAGAIGGYLGAKLAATDAEVSLIARGPPSGRHAVDRPDLDRGRKQNPAGRDCYR